MRSVFRMGLTVTDGGPTDPPCRRWPDRDACAPFRTAAQTAGATTPASLRCNRHEGSAKKAEMCGRAALPFDQRAEASRECVCVCVGGGVGRCVCVVVLECVGHLM